VSAIAWNSVRDEFGITVRHQWNAQVDHQPALLPVSVDSQESFLTVPLSQPDRSARNEGVIEVEIGGARVVLRGSVDPANVRSVLIALREIA
jgi:transposase